MLRFVNVVRLLVGYLAAALTGIPVRTKLPDKDLTTRLPFVRVIRDPGSEEETTARPRITLECFAADEATMWDLAEASHNAMRALSGSAMGGQLVDVVLTVQDPTDRPWSPTVARSVAVYELQLRPTAA